MPEKTFLSTKLHLPALPPGLVSRVRLKERLNEGRQAGRRIVLVSAPAGFGKTTSVVEWLQSRGGLRRAWVTLDPGDDDPVRFVSCLVAALRQLDPGVGHDLEGGLRTGDLPTAELVTATLANDLVQIDADSLVVLDDLHSLQNPFVLEIVAGLASAGLPKTEIVLITREDPPVPLGRLRANNQLTEIRARHLRFDPIEVRRFLNDSLGLSLTDRNLSVLADRTEGWAAGLQLAGLSLREATDPSALVAGLAGGHRYILQYLTEQVLDHQSPKTRTFLLETALLDRLCGDVCDAVTGRNDGSAMLRQLETANLFVVPLDESGRWFRYHHLFADLLREFTSELGDARVRTVHRRAGSWFAANGLPDRAVTHLLAAEDFEHAVELIESHAMDMVMQGFARTVSEWVRALPKEWADRSSRTSLALAWTHMLHGEFATAQTFLERADAAAGQETGDHAASAESLVMQSLYAAMNGDRARSTGMAERATALAPEHDLRVRGLAYLALAQARQGAGDMGGAIEAYRQSIDLGRLSDTLAVELIACASLGAAALDSGRIQFAYDIAAPVIEHADDLSVQSPFHGMIYGLAAEAKLLWLRLDDAQRSWERADRLCTIGGFLSGMIGCKVKLARTARLAGDEESAARHLRNGLDLLRPNTPGYLRKEVAAEQVCLMLAQRGPAAALVVLEEFGLGHADNAAWVDPARADSLSSSDLLLLCAGLRYLAYVARSTGARDSVMSALRLADFVIAQAIASGRRLAAIEALVLRAGVIDIAREAGEPEAGDTGAARDPDSDYRDALVLADGEEPLAIFVDLGQAVVHSIARLRAGGTLNTASAILAGRIEEAWAARPVALRLREPREADGARKTGRQSAAPADTSPLTSRETEVVRLMAEGLQYKEIASGLYVSLNTVRFHVKSIYGKLGVSNRTRALERARDLGVI